MPAPHLPLPGALIFITQVTHRRFPLLEEPWSAELLLDNLRQTKALHVFHMRAYVILPDHFHLMIKCDERVLASTVMSSLKSNFSKDFKVHRGIQGRVDIWQRGWWEHNIRNEADFERHLHYIHYNPVYHGVAAHPEDWVYSSFAEWSRRGVYPERWGWSLEEEFGWLRQVEANAAELCGEAGESM